MWACSESALAADAAIRAFVALDVDEALRREVARVQEMLSQRAGNVKWVDPALCHLTLKFLGNVPESRLPAVQQACAEAAGTGQPFELVFEGLGAFPRPRDPRVLWMGITAGLPELARLQSAVERALGAAGCPAEARPFSPHLTLGRLRKPPPRTEAAALEAAVRRCAGRVFGRVSAQRLQLMRSVIGRSGPAYTVLAEYALQGA